MAFDKIKRVQVVQDGTALRITFVDTSEVIVPSPTKLGLVSTITCRGTRLYLNGKPLLDVADHLDPGEVC